MSYLSLINPMYLLKYVILQKGKPKEIYFSIYNFIRPMLLLSLLNTMKIMIT